MTYGRVIGGILEGNIRLPSGGSDSPCYDMARTLVAVVTKEKFEAPSLGDPGRAVFLSLPPIMRGGRSMLVAKMFAGRHVRCYVKNEWRLSSPMVVTVYGAYSYD